WAVTRLIGLPVVTSTVIAWLVAVFFAYWSNRKFVFQSKTSSLVGIFFEAVYFFAARIATGVFDVAFMWLFADVLALNDVIVKVVSNVIVVILNYVASKMFVFKPESEAKKS
ncbi:MAG: GtrA family protein, partial [Synergistaceae bacterium]|nr:GtrA family protein [Synergistaceae bacterium]